MWLKWQFRFLKEDRDSGKFHARTYDVEKTHPSWIQEQRHRAFGKCYTIHPDEKTRKESQQADECLAIWCMLKSIWQLVCKIFIILSCIFQEIGDILHEVEFVSMQNQLILKSQKVWKLTILATTLPSCTFTETNSSLILAEEWGTLSTWMNQLNIR